MHVVDTFLVLVFLPRIAFPHPAAPESGAPCGCGPTHRCPPTAPRRAWCLAGAVLGMRATSADAKGQGGRGHRARTRPVRTLRDSRSSALGSRVHFPKHVPWVPPNATGRPVLGGRYCHRVRKRRESQGQTAPRRGSRPLPDGGRRASPPTAAATSDTGRQAAGNLLDGAQTPALQQAHIWITPLRVSKIPWKAPPLPPSPFPHAGVAAGDGVRPSDARPFPLVRSSVGVPGCTAAGRRPREPEGLCEQGQHSGRHMAGAQ